MLGQLALLDTVLLCRINHTEVVSEGESYLQKNNVKFVVSRDCTFSFFFKP
jgi:hypothetical protein